MSMRARIKSLQRSEPPQGEIAVGNDDATNYALLGGGWGREGGCYLCATSSRGHNNSKFRTLIITRASRWWTSQSNYRSCHPRDKNCQLMMIYFNVVINGLFTHTIFEYFHSPFGDINWFLFNFIGNRLEFYWFNRETAQVGGILKIKPFCNT